MVNFSRFLTRREWAGKETALSFLAHLIDISQYLDFHDVDNDSPLQSKLFAYAHWLGECKSASIWRPQILKRLAQVMNTDSLPVTIRAKAMAALCFSNEKGIAALFHSYLLSGYPTIKNISFFGMRNIAGSNFDQSPGRSFGRSKYKRSSICLYGVYYCMDREDTLEFIVKILLQADENLRRSCCRIADFKSVRRSPGSGRWYFSSRYYGKAGSCFRFGINAE